MRRIKSLVILLVFAGAYLSTAFRPQPPAEGMYPISFLSMLNLEEMGINLKAEDIFDEKGNGLINAVVRIGGCTGSFISPEGLILTNHHCVFSSLKPHTNQDHNYMRDGFNSLEEGKELPMEGYTVRIMKSYTDVSERVLEGLEEIEDPIIRDRQIRANIQRITQEEQEATPDFEIEISEMLVGASYVLFRYDYLKDLRLVYVPPRYIGEFGGETDNWMWPRHSGDFSFVRAYVDENGNPAPYSENNVPYNPSKFLKVNFDGVEKEDAVFVLGYPGRTFRHNPAEFIRFMEEVQMPYIADLWEWEIDQMEALSERSDQDQIRYATRIKRLANTMKNYRGKLQSLKRINLYEKKKNEEQVILNRIKEMEPEDNFDEVMREINALYGEQIAMGERYFWHGQLAYNSKPMEIARAVVAYSGMEIDDQMRKRMIKSLRSLYQGGFDPYTDSLFAHNILRNGLDYNIPGLRTVIEDKATLRKYITKSFTKSKLLDSAWVIRQFEKDPSKLRKSKDPLIRLQLALEDDANTVAAESQRIAARLRMLQPIYVDAKMKSTGGLFIPDANATLRFTHGHIKGYNPSDAVELEPITTLNGILEKAAQQGDYKLEEEMKHAIAVQNRGEFYKESLKSVPVNLLYNTDTSGGNSGSPILDENGELIGLNFDRCFEACVNDFAWNDSYSRSIGVDMRYILWVTQNIGNAGNIVEEIRN